MRSTVFNDQVDKQYGDSRPAGPVTRGPARLVAALTIFIGFANLGFGPPAVVDADERAVPMYPSHVEQIAALTLPDVGAEAFAIVDATTGRLVAGRNAHERLAPASTTKIATALVALERGDLNQLVPIDVDSRLMYGSSVMGLVPGEVLTLRDLLFGLLLPSGNDAAIAIARHIGGSEERFVALMNAKAAELGLRDTRFANPHGLDEDEHYSSAYDLAHLGRYAMANGTFAHIVATREIEVQGHRSYHMYNTNHLLYRYPGSDGVKTGYTENAMQTLVASAVRDSRRVFVTVIRSRDRVGDTIPLLDHVYEHYGWRQLDLPANPLNGIGSPDGRGRRLTVRPIPEVCLPKWQLPFIRSYVWLDDALASGEREGQRLGMVGFYLGPTLLAEVPAHAR